MTPTLLDQNLSPKLCGMLSDVFPLAAHVRDFDLQEADDVTVWEFARTNGYTIVSKDSDFHQRSFVYGHPPKVVWIRCGNVSTLEIATIVRHHATRLAEFQADRDASLLIIS